MVDFIIRKINKPYAKYLIFGISAESPLFRLDDIKMNLQISNGEKVLFDQLLQTGNTENRFLTLTYIDNNFDFTSATNIETSIIDDNTRSVIAEFLRDNSLILKYSILLTNQKEIILNGGNI